MTQTDILPSLDSLADVRAHARQWLFEAAAPLWAGVGVCPDGLFAERLSLQGERVVMPRRLRVQARQIFSFCTIGRLGWDGPWREIVTRAVDILITRGRRADGLFCHLFDETGAVSNHALDLYDHAFGLFALAHAGQMLDRPDLFDIAEEIQDRLDQDWRRPEGGFWEGELTPCPPYRQNPHMHMFEAALAHSRFSGRPRWRLMVDELAALFRNRFQDSASGAVTEYFDRDWGRLPGEEGIIAEPGHCLEWAWLFEVGFDDGSGVPVSDALTAFARSNGLCTSHGVAINEVRTDGSIRDAGARLWPQTERLKAAIARLNRTGSREEELEAISAYKGLIRYWDTPALGVWRDRLNADGSWVEEDAPASSFYHIVCALHELLS